ncbi:MAG: CPBP family intramembrane glutamic endopeptidase [Saprospiraceae bacterium]
MRMNKTWRIILIVFLSFFAYHYFRQFFGPIKGALDNITHFGLLSYLLTYLLIGLPIFIGTYFINREKNILKSLGLTNKVAKAFLFALLFTLPMLIGGAAFFTFHTHLKIENLIAGSIVIGFIEELYFRGFLFGQLYRYTNIGFIPAICFGALIFASGHLYQSQDLNELIGIFVITFMGAILFAWLYVEWDYNLWVPIFLHSFMNLSWHLFEMDETALGGITANILRGLTIAFAIAFTVISKKRSNQKLAINRETILLKS